MKNRDWLEISDHWATPKWLYDKLDAEFHFDFDPCPLHAKFDWLKIEWGGGKFCEPSLQPKRQTKIYSKSLRGVEKVKNLRSTYSKCYRYKTIPWFNPTKRWGTFS